MVMRLKINTRVFRFKERTLPWYFKIIHLPGKTKFGPDAASCYPPPVTEGNNLPRGCLLESTVAAAISIDAQNLASITWDLLVEET